MPKTWTVRRERDLIIVAFVDEHGTVVEVHLNDQSALALGDDLMRLAVTNDVP